MENATRLPRVFLLTISRNQTTPNPHITEAPRFRVEVDPVVTVVKSALVIVDSLADGGYYDLSHKNRRELGSEFVFSIPEELEGRLWVEVLFRPERCQDGPQHKPGCVMSFGYSWRAA